MTAVLSASIAQPPLTSQILQILRLTRASDQVQQVRRQSIFSDFQKKLKEEIERYDISSARAYSDAMYISTSFPKA